MGETQITSRLLSIMGATRFTTWDEFVGAARSEGLEVSVEHGEAYFTTAQSASAVAGSSLDLGDGMALNLPTLQDYVQAIGEIWSEATEGFEGTLEELVALQAEQRRAGRDARLRARARSLSPSRHRILGDRSYGG